MSRGYVVAERDVEGRPESGTAEERVTIDRSCGCERLEQRVLRFASGRSEKRTPGERQELLYVVSGTGRLVLGADAHRLEADTAALVLPGETYLVETEDELVVVSVTAPGAGRSVRPSVTVRLEDAEEQPADEQRTFRVLVETDLTQFVGIVQPCRAPDHSHPYDEVGYILEGRGFAHVGGTAIPIEGGSCFHLPPGTVHCIENTGPGVMRILGVFHPSGSPRQRSYDAANS